MMKLLCLFLLIIGVNSIYINDDEAVSGMRATISSLPYQAQLLQNGLYICGATIISSTWLLTAAHCVQESFSGKWSIRIGIDDVLMEGNRYVIQRIIPHPKYKFTTTHNDVALLELEKPIVFNELQQPIALSTKSPRTGDTMVISGFGKRGEYLGYSQHLLMANVTVVDYTSCAHKYRKDPITKTMFCAGDGSADTCQGDSGGPGVIDGELAGVASSGKNCGSAYYPGVYMDVYKYRDWIEQYVELPKKKISSFFAIIKNLLSS